MRPNEILFQSVEAAPSIRTRTPDGAAINDEILSVLGRRVRYDVTTNTTAVSADEDIIYFPLLDPTANPDFTNKRFFARFMPYSGRMESEFQTDSGSGTTCPNGCKPNTTLCGTIKDPEPPGNANDPILPGSDFIATFKDCDNVDKELNLTNDTEGNLKHGDDVIVHVMNDCSIKVVACCVLTPDPSTCETCIENLDGQSIEFTLAGANINWPANCTPALSDWSGNYSGVINYDGTTASVSQDDPQNRLGTPVECPVVFGVTVASQYHTWGLEISCNGGNIDIFLSVARHQSTNYPVGLGAPPEPYPVTNAQSYLWYFSGPYDGCGSYDLSPTTLFGTPNQIPGSTCAINLTP